MAPYEFHYATKLAFYLSKNCKLKGIFKGYQKVFLNDYAELDQKKTYIFYTIIFSPVKYLL